MSKKPYWRIYCPFVDVLSYALTLGRANRGARTVVIRRGAPAPLRVVGGGS